MYNERHRSAGSAKQQCKPLLPEIATPRVEATAARTRGLAMFVLVLTTLRQTKSQAIPRLQCAFESRVLGVSCISHRLSQLAAFFLDQQAE